MQFHLVSPDRDQCVSSFCRDPIMERLVRALLPAEESETVLRGFYTNANHAALLRQVAERRGDAPADPARRTTMRLANWRLKRVHDHVEENLAGRLSLADLAASAGLSPMHFAAQFRGATGMRPHDYVLHRRIEHAKSMLSDTALPIMAVALRVGFRTAAHFTTAFKRLTGVTPTVWRASRIDHAAAVDHALAA